MSPAGLACCLLLAAPAAPRPAAGVVTILEGPGRLMRGPAWFALAEGTRVQEEDVVEVGAGAKAQVELAGGVLVGLAGPGAVYLASVPLRDGKPSAPADLFVSGGWLKASAKAPALGLRLRTALGPVVLEDAIAVLQAGPGADALFLESGTARLLEPDPGRKARGGEFWSRAAGKPFTSAPRPTPAFLAGMPRPYMDPLPARAARTRDVPVAPASGRGVLYSEAQPWLSGPNRRSFLKRLRPRLEDAAFRAAVEADIRAYPEWDRILHPEKYEPRTDGQKR